MVELQNSFEIDQAKMNPLKIAARKIMLPKGQDEILDKLRGSISAAMIGLSKEVIHCIMLIAKREWEKTHMRQLNDFRFMHVNERIAAFDEMLKTFVAQLNTVLVRPLDESEIEFMRKNVLTNYKDLLETEGYVVSYEI
ncbi:MAG: hypothetical protein ACTSQE_05050 [Candidatus Heimdallarchaeaceae archaeon]